MKKLALILLLSLCFIGCKHKSTATINIDGQTNVKKHLLAQMDSLSESLIDYEKLVNTSNDTLKIRQAFITNRKIFKRLEWATEYFLPKSSRSINGPALDILELDENYFIHAEGFQVLEEYIFPSVDLTQKKEMIREIRTLENLIRTGRVNIEVSHVSLEHIMDAIRLEVFRITTMGISGFDTPVGNLLFVEAKESLYSVKQVMQMLNFPETEKNKKLYHLIDKAQAIISGNPHRNSFDYLEFITDYLDPIAVTLHDIQREQNIDFVDKDGALPSSTASLFQKNAFNIDAFSPSKKYFISDQKIALGKELFFDNRFSENNQRSCSSCHNPDKAYTDGLKTALALNGKPLPRNSPSLNYAVFYHGLFWDMRQSNLESLSTSVVENQEEMHGNMKNIVAQINKDAKYVEKFKKVYPDYHIIEQWQIENVLASFIRSLATFSSDFDDYMRGNKQALNQEEKQGFNVFMGKGKCATCHFIPIFNGTLPPKYASSEQEVLGVPADKTNTTLDSDLGRYKNNTPLDQLKNSFKTVTVRNVEKTAPYMHNGVHTTLEEVVDFYNEGGGLGLGIKVENQTLPEDKLNLTPEESKALIAFMKALSDK